MNLERENGKAVTDSVQLFLTANAIARRNCVGRIDVVENGSSGSSPGDAMRPQALLSSDLPM